MQQLKINLETFKSTSFHNYTLSSSLNSSPFTCVWYLILMFSVTMRTFAKKSCVYLPTVPGDHGRNSLVMEVHLKDDLTEDHKVGVFHCWIAFGKVCNRQKGWSCTGWFNVNFPPRLPIVYATASFGSSPHRHSHIIP